MAIQSKYKPDINIPALEMRKIGLLEKRWIKEDALKGISQGLVAQRFGNYTSEAYKKYKANYMKRFTDRTGNKGTKLKSHQGQAVVSNETAFVNETLTGAMFRDMFVQEAIDNSVTISYAAKDAGKVLGAQDRNRIIVDLNKDNRDKVVDEMFKVISKNIDDWSKEDINITIKLL
jgi:hypothetical protein